MLRLSILLTILLVHKDLIAQKVFSFSKLLCVFSYCAFYSSYHNHFLKIILGQAWLLATLAEGSLLSYLQCILAEPRAIGRLYAPHAILRDPSCVSQLSSLLTGLESINILVEVFMNNAQINLNICIVSTFCT